MSNQVQCKPLSDRQMNALIGDICLAFKGGGPRLIERLRPTTDPDMIKTNPPGQETEK